MSPKYKNQHQVMYTKDSPLIKSLCGLELHLWFNDEVNLTQAGGKVVPGHFNIYNATKKEMTDIQILMDIGEDIPWWDIEVGGCDVVKTSNFGQGIVEIKRLPAQTRTECRSFTATFNINHGLSKCLA